ncbi:MAG: Dihydrolipoyllysine-residue acetyltransferase [Clostridium sp.]
MLYHMLTTFKATAKKLPDGLQVESNSRGFKILYDEPEELGGTNAGMNPVEALLCTLGACQSIVASSFAAAHDFTFEEFSVELEGDLDPDGFMGAADVRKGFQEIRYVMHFKTKESQEKAEAFADFIENTCPIGDCLANGVKLVRAGVVRD